MASALSIADRMDQIRLEIDRRRDDMRGISPKTSLYQRLAREIEEFYRRLDRLQAERMRT